MSKQPRALELAEELEEAAGDHFAWHKHLGYQSAALLRSQHELIGELVEVLSSLRFGLPDGWRVVRDAEAVLSKAKEQQ